jgi:hypothetical protein
MLSILGIVVIVVAAIHTYRSARDTGRRAGLWLLAALVVGIGLQFIVPVVMGIVLAIYCLATGSSQAQLMEDLSGWSMVIGIGCLVLSIVGMLYIAKRAAVVPDEPAVQAPPPPPSFGDQL